MVLEKHMRGHGRNNQIESDNGLRDCLIFLIATHRQTRKESLLWQSLYLHENGYNTTDVPQTCRRPYRLNKFLPKRDRGLTMFEMLDGTTVTEFCKTRVKRRVFDGMPLFKIGKAKNAAQRDKPYAPETNSLSHSPTPTATLCSDKVQCSGYPPLAISPNHAERPKNSNSVAESTNSTSTPRRIDFANYYAYLKSESSSPESLISMS